MRYTDEVKEIAFGYFCKGLNSKEIIKLMDSDLKMNFRTIQEFSRTNDWKERRAALRLKEEKRIVRKYRKQQRQKESAKAEK